MSKWMHPIAKNHLYKSQCPVPISTNVIWSEEGNPFYLPRGRERHIKVYKTAAENLIHARYRRFLENRPSTPSEPLTGADATGKHRSSTHAQNVILSRGST